MACHAGRPHTPLSTLSINTEGELKQEDRIEALSLTYGTDGRALLWAALTALRLCLIAFTLAARAGTLGLRQAVGTRVTRGLFRLRMWRQGG
jgi:hypothetical protein